jgi:alanine-glyoxylate transaminase/serine-glyoxylate transaminase/serine-pyruvate transaminase
MSIGQLNVPQRLLMGPGPSDVHPRVLTVMATPLLGHLDPQFLGVMHETQELLRGVFRTKNRVTFPVSATGMAGMECCLSNLLEPGDKVVICRAGFFGQRLVEVAERTRAEITAIDAPWGEVFDPNRLRDTLKQIRPKVLAIVNAETSTGAHQPVDLLGRLCHEFDTLLLVDAVTALGCTPLEIDKWEIDSVYSCSQKGLGCPPGLAPVSFSDRAIDAINRRKTKCPSWYLDVTTVQKYWGEEHAYHHTAPITMIYALREGLRLVLEEGLEERWARHRRNHQALKVGLKALGLQYTANEAHQLPQLNAVRLPAGVDDATVRKHLLVEFGIEIGGGLGEFKGRAWRIGLMGYNSRPSCVMQILAALEQCLKLQGVNVAPGAGVAAAVQAYAQMGPP